MYKFPTFVHDNLPLKSSLGISIAIYIMFRIQRNTAQRKVTIWKIISEIDITLLYLVFFAPFAMIPYSGAVWISMGRVQIFMADLPRLASMHFLFMRTANFTGWLIITYKVLQTTVSSCVIPYSAFCLTPPAQVHATYSPIFLSFVYGTFSLRHSVPMSEQD